jgi:aspartyl-tRNA(Asn)/glutamyl-tRNA(Gln) amidotransferase subunit B
MYKPTIGLEIHAELKTESKMFCSCANDPNERRPNVNICPICMGHPGTLPVINEQAVKKVIKTGLALNSQIPERSKFDRKNYFYPDLPKGYQISQYDMPLCKGGFLEINKRKIQITRIHLEEDTGSLVHPKGYDYSLVDFNRAGRPLMELVTEPDLHSAQEARNFAEELQLILKYLGVSDADMEKGQMRVEVNISLGEKNKLGTKVEIKNLNSFRAVEKGVEYEIKRQTEILERGEKVKLETRGWHDAKQITLSQREKEGSRDYRYFPEPDLPMLRVGNEIDVDEIKKEIPELPQQRRERFKKEYGLDEKSIEVFTQNKNLGNYFEKVISELRNWIKIKKLKFSRNLIKLTSNYIINELGGIGAKFQILSSEFSKKITPENFAEFITLIEQGKISSKIAKMVLLEMFETSADPSHIIEEKKLIQLTNETEIEKVVKQVISKNSKPVEDYKKGKQNALQFLVGKVMAETRGKAKPEIVCKILTNLLRN